MEFWSWETGIGTSSTLCRDLDGIAVLPGAVDLLGDLSKKQQEWSSEIKAKEWMGYPFLDLHLQTRCF